VESSKMTVKNNILVIVLCVGQLFAGACSDRRESSFASVKEARSSGWGWVPSGLPESATDLHELHDVDTNEVWGTFRLSDPSSITLTRVQASSVTGHSVRSPSASWWPEILTGNLDGRTLEQRGFKFYSTPAPFEFWIAIDRNGGRGFFWSSRR
jgi:hypothetical protein